MDKAHITYTWIARVTGTASILGSSSIIYMVLSDRNNKLSRSYHRIMLLMSVFDVFQSIALVVTGVAMPRESGIHGAKGNVHTCIAQGMFMVLGLAVPLYNCCLNVYYVLTIRYSVSSEQFAKFEPILHAISILLPLSMAILFAARDDITPRMSGVCIPSGELAYLIVSSVIGFSILVCIASMICICWTVHSQSETMKKYTPTFLKRGGSSTARRSRVNDDKKKTINQAVLYLLAFISTYIFPIINSIYSKGNSGLETPNAVLILSSIFYPLQGFWNFLLYIRPGVKRVMKRNPDKSYFRAVRDTIFVPSSLQLSDKKKLLPPRGLDEVEINAAHTIDIQVGADNLSSDEISITNELTKKYDKSEAEVLKISFISTQEDRQEVHRRDKKTITDIGKEDQSETVVAGNSALYNAQSSELYQSEDDIESQVGVHHNEEVKGRRLSLASIASIINDRDSWDSFGL